MTSRPRTGRGAATREGGKDVDLEADLVSRIVDGLRKADEYHRICEAVQKEVFDLEQEIKDEGGRKWKDPPRTVPSLHLFSEFCLYLFHEERGQVTIRGPSSYHNFHVGDIHIDSIENHS